MQLDIKLIGYDDWERPVYRDKNGNLYKDIIDGKYKKTKSVFEIPLSKVQKYKFIKKQVPEVFLTDL